MKRYAAQSFHSCFAPSPHSPPARTPSSPILLMLCFLSQHPQRKTSTTDFPHAPITSPPLCFPVSLIASSQCLLSVSPFFLHFLNISFLCSDLDSPSISWWCLHQFFIADFPSKLLYITHLLSVSIRGTSKSHTPSESCLAHKNCCLSQLYKRQICHFSTQIRNHGVVGSSNNYIQSLDRFVYLYLQNTSASSH